MTLPALNAYLVDPLRAVLQGEPQQGIEGEQLNLLQ
jgi:hypothetical protein